MIKVLCAVLLLLASLDARENPFFPAKGEKDIPYTTNLTQNIEPLKRSSITLPSSARIIKKVTIEYENLDATVETKSIELKNTVDWHLPIFISQSYIEVQKKDEKQVVQKKEAQEFKEIASTKYAKFFENFKSLKIVTEDKIIRDFLLVKPHRIVLDFKRDASIKSYSKENKNSRFSKIRVGNHAGYYRAVVELDGLYRYKMKKVYDGYILNLR
ncbi:hypothetical protein M947_08210 [Sulfurimonas hongkongensis]|uniref:AMIN domain-containing protein n=1 Tax=Sulfurimonas hongkongensis TaxID=1172190 RepID=T0KPW1_9BACT|nr:AMIN domain-containing protein [Sulfurimonas hongkongensis]EQB39134.1 hypothetical protein M947_08210 [Sulfurimonas hongkongensis]